MLISDDFRDTVIESLADAVENYDNAALAVEDEDAVESFTTTADLFAGTLMQVQAGRDLDVIDLDVVRSALALSVANCADLDLDDAKYGYQAALDSLSAPLPS